MNRRQKKSRDRKKTQEHDLKFYQLNEAYKRYKSKDKARQQLENQYKHFKRLANQRMTNIEKLTKQKKYKNLDSFAYRKAMIDIKNFFGENARRFEGTENLSNRQIEARINSMLEFLNSPSSTKYGVERVWAKRENTLMEKYGSYGLTWTKALDIFERGIIKKYEAEMNSDLVLKVIATNDADNKKFTKFIKDNVAKDYHSHTNPESLIKWLTNAKSQGKLKEEDLLKYVKAQEKDN